MEDKTDNSEKKEEHDSLKPARDAIATAMRAAQFAKADRKSTRLNSSHAT